MDHELLGSRPVRIGSTCQRRRLYVNLVAAAMLIMGMSAVAQRTMASSGGMDPDPKPKPTSNRKNKVKIDPELLRKMDEVLGKEKSREAFRQADLIRQNRGRPRTATSTKPNPRANPSRPRTSPRGVPAARSPSSVSGANTMLLNIAPMQNDVPPEDRKYMFSMKDVTYSQLVEAFARQTGLGVIGEAPKDGKVSFISTRELSFRESISQLRLLLFNYKPLEPYFIDRQEDHLEVSRLNDKIRRLEQERMYRTVDDYLVANLPDDEIALVIFTPTTGSIADLKQVRDQLPDYVRLAPIGNTNSVTIFARVVEIEKFLWLYEFFKKDEDSDPRIIKRIPIEFITPTQALDRLDDLMDLGNTAKRAKPRITSRGKTTNLLEILREPEVTIVPDDERGVLLVRAMKDKIRAIEAMLPYIDLPLAGADYPPVIIPVKHADPDTLIASIQQVLAATDSARKRGVARVAPKRATTATRGSRASTASIKQSGGITMFTHPYLDAIVVIAEDSDVQHVRRLIDQFDVWEDQPVRMMVEHADATALAEQIRKMLGGTGKNKSPAGRPYQLIPSSENHSIWYIGGNRYLNRVRELIAVLDIESPETIFHQIMLRHQTPSFVASLLKELDSGLGAGLVITTKPVRSVKPTARNISKFTPNDEDGVLYVLCTETEWQRYKKLIEDIDQSVDNSPPFVILPVHHITPEEAVVFLSPLIEHKDPRKVSVKLITSEHDIHVYGASGRQLEDMQSILALVDLPVEMEERIFDFEFASPAQIKTAIEALISGADTKGKSARTRAKAGAKNTVTVSSGSNLTILEIGDRLFVRTTPEKMQAIVELIEKFDVADPTHETRVYKNFAPGTDLENMADTLASLLGGSPVGGVRIKGKVRGQSPDGPRFFPLALVGQLIVMAPKAQFPDIEEMIELLRKNTKEDTPIQVAFIEVTYIDPEELLEQIEPLLELKYQELEDEDGPVLSISTKQRKSRKSSGHFHLAADVRNKRLVMAAKSNLIEHARELVLAFDREVDEGGVMIFTTVRLSHANSKEMIKAVNEMINGHASRPGRRATPKPGTLATGRSITPLVVLEAPGGGAIVLHGYRDEVDQAIEWINQLDEISSTGRSIKVYEIKRTDIKTLGDLIMAVVEKPKERKGIQLPRRSKKDDNDDDDIFVFEVTKTWTGREVYIHADLIARSMIVATTESNLKIIDGIIKQFEEGDETIVADAPSIPKFVYELQYADAYGAESSAYMLFDQMWDGRDKPQVESAWFGNSLVIRHPDEARFDEIRGMIKQYIDIESPITNRTINFLAPQGMSARDVALWLQMNRPEMEFEIEDVTPAGDETYGMEIVGPKNSKSKTNRCVLPSAFSTMVDQIMATSLAQTSSRGSKSSKKENNNIFGAAKRALEEMGLDDGYSPKRSRRLLTGQKLKIRYDNSTGTITIEGADSILSDVPGWIDDLKEEIEELPSMPDIRVVRLKYISVQAAADILGEMFNATRLQRAAATAAQRRAQQQATQQANRQRQQAQRGGQAGRNASQQRGRGQQPQPGQAPQLPPTSVRIFSSPYDRTLILRADTSQYPAIFNLLATIDKPKPFDAEMRIFPLTKLNAGEVEEVLKEILGLNATSTRRAAPSGGARGGASRSTSSRSAGGSLPKTILQETTTGSLLGIDPGDIKLSSSDATNSIVAVAPPKALDFIGELIESLESEDIPERETRYYELQHGDPEEIATYLTSQFSPESQTGSKKDGGGRSLNKPSFIPYPRLKQLTVIAIPEQITEIDDIIDRLDRADESGEWKDVTLKYADAGSVAATLEKMFGAVGRGSRGSANRGLPVRFIGESGSRMLHYQAPVSLHEQITTAIDLFEEEASQTQEIRTIRLVHIKPSKLADAVEAAYGNKRSGKRNQVSRFIVTANDPTNLLFVRADDAMFEQIQSLAKTLDQLRDYDFEFKFYPLKFADAKKTHAMMTKLMTDYIRRLGAGAKGMDAFSVDVDEKANALIVLGGPAIFGFLEENLARIDIPANARSPKGSLMIVLKNARASDIANNINRFWGGKKKGGYGEVKAEANNSINMLIVRGPQDLLDEINKEFIVPLRENMPALATTRIYKLKHADAEQLARALQNVYRLIKGSRRNQQPVGFSPDISTNSLLITANSTEMEKITKLIKSLDVEPDLERGVQIKTIAMTHADPYNVESAIKQLFGRGRNPSDRVTVVADGGSRSVIVSASSANLIRIEGLIDQLDTEEGSHQEVHVVQLVNADPSQIARTLTEIYIRSVPRRGKGAPPISISALQNSKAILVKAGAEDFSDIAATIEELDREDVVIGEEVRLVTLLFADATEINTALKEYLRKPGGGGRRGAQLSGDMRLSVLSSSNAIVISGDEVGVDRVEELVKQLDQADEEGSIPQIISLQHVEVSQIMPTLQEMFPETRRGGGRRNKQAPMFGSNEALNAIIVKADRSDLAAIRGMIEQLDTRDAAGSEMIRVVMVASGINVTDLAFTVETSINTGAQAASSRGSGRGRGRGNVPSITITPNLRTSSLIMSGSESLFNRAEQLANKLVEMGPSGKAIKIISLGDFAADDLLRLIDSLKGDQGSGRSGRGSNTRRGSSNRGRRNNAQRPNRRGGRRP